MKTAKEKVGESAAKESERKLSFNFSWLTQVKQEDQ